MLSDVTLSIKDYIRYHQRPVIFGLVIASILSIALVLAFTYFSPILTAAIVFAASFLVITPLAALVRYAKLRLFYKEEVVVVRNKALDDIVASPRKLNQGNANICGMAATASMMLAVDPTKFAKLVQTLHHNGHTLGPRSLYLLTSREIRRKQDLVTKFLYSMRYSSNWFGYSTGGPSFFELFRGVTRPRRIAEFLLQYGFSDVVDTTEVISHKRKQPLSWWRRFIYGGVYFGNHRTFETKDEHLKYVADNVSVQKPAVMLMSAGLAAQILFGRDFISDVIGGGSGLAAVLDFAVDHYVFVDYFAIEGDFVRIRIHTWGHEAVRRVPKVYFEEHFRGIVTGDYVRPEAAPAPPAAVPDPSQPLDQAQAYSFVQYLFAGSSVREWALRSAFYSICSDREGRPAVDMGPARLSGGLGYTSRSSSLPRVEGSAGERRACEA